MKLRGNGTGVGTVLVMLLVLLALLNGAAAMSAPAPEPDLELEEEDSAMMYQIALAPLSIAPSSSSSIASAEYNIATVLQNSTLGFGATSSGDVWVYNNGPSQSTCLQVYQRLSSSSDPTSVGSYAEKASIECPVSCPQPSFEQSGDSLLFFGKYQYCAPKAGMLVQTNEGTEVTRFDPIQQSTVTPVLEYDPALKALVGIAKDNGTNAGSGPGLACDSLANPEEIAGKYCLVARGSCLYINKYDVCLNAGAVGVVVVNYNEDLPPIGGTEYERDVPIIMIRNSDGDAIVSAVETYGEDNVTLTVGASVPSQEVDYGLTWAVVDLETFSEVDLGNTTLPTEWVQDHAGFADDDESYLYVYEITDPPFDTYGVDITSLASEGTLETLGSYVSNGPSPMYLVPISIDGESFMMQRISGGMELTNVTDPSAPELISTVTIDNSYCPRTITPIYIYAHKEYVYATDFLKFPESPECPGVDGIGTYPVKIYDYSTPSSPVFKGYFGVSEVTDYNSARFYWGEGEYEDIALVAMTSAGLVFYDFSDPLQPVAVSDAVLTDASQLPESLAYNGGVMSSQGEDFPQAVYIGDGSWLVSVTSNGNLGTLYEVMLHK